MRLLTARTLSMLGMAFEPVALAFGVLGLPGADASTLSIILAAEVIPAVALLLVGGVLADRFPRNRVMVCGELLNAIAFAAIAAMLISGWAPVPLLTAAAGVSGLGQAVLFPALTGIIPEVVPVQCLQSGNALLALGANTARIAGVVAGGATVALFGSGWAMMIGAVLFGSAALLLVGLSTGGRGGGSDSVWRDLREGWTEFRSRQWLWVVVAQFSLLILVLQAAHGVLGPLVAKSELGGPTAWSAVLAGEAIGMVCGVAVAMRIRPRRPILFATLLMFVPALPYLLLGISAPLWSVVVGAALMGFAFDLFGVLWQTTMQREVPAASLSRVSSYDAFGSLLFGPVGLLLAGPAATLVGAHKALIGCAVVGVMTTAAALCTPGVRALRDTTPQR